MKMINARTARVLIASALVMAVAWFANAALVRPALINGNATYVPISTPGGGHTSYVYTVNGLTPGSRYTLVTDGSAQKIDNFYALNPANVVHLSTKSGTHSIVSFGDTIYFYGSASHAVNSHLSRN